MNTLMSQYMNECRSEEMNECMHELIDKHEWTNDEWIHAWMHTLMNDAWMK